MSQGNLLLVVKHVNHPAVNNTLKQSAGPNAFCKENLAPREAGCGAGW